MADQASMSLRMDRVVGSRPMSLLKSAGFKKSRRSFWREVGGVWQVVNFQSSRWNTSRRANFTANFLLSFPGYHAMRFGRAAPKNPAAAWPMWDMPMDFLKGERFDDWWCLDAELEPEALGSEVADKIEKFGLPFFEPYMSLAAVAKDLDESARSADASWIPTVNWSILKWCSGERTHAIRRLEECREAMSPDSYTSVIESVLRRMQSSP